MLLVIYRVGKHPKLVLEQIRELGYESRPILVVDPKNRAAIDAAGACFMLLSKPATKSPTSPMGKETIARALAGVREEIAIVIGEDGLVETVNELAAPTTFRLEVGEAAVLEIDEEIDWATALARAKGWEWLFTLVTDP